MLRTILIASTVLATIVVQQALLNHARDHRPSDIDALLDVPAVPSAATRLLTLGLQSAAADLHYMQAIQLYGDQAQTRGSEAEKSRRSSAIARLLEYATDLDPRFVYAYVFGAMAIPVPLFDGGADQVPAAISLLRKGTDAVHDWRIPFNLAYLAATYEARFDEAARYMAEAASRPGRPAYVPLLATRLAAHGSSLDTSIGLARAMLDAADTDEQKADLEKRILLLTMERHLRAIEAAVRAFHARNERFPTSLDELVSSGLLPSVPPEPHGGRYTLDPTTGVASSTGAERLRLPKSVTEEIERHTRPAAEQPTP